MLYICSICNKDCLSASKLAHHLVSDHKPPNWKDFRCNICNTYLKDAASFRIHMALLHPQTRVENQPSNTGSTLNKIALDLSIDTKSLITKNTFARNAYKLTAKQDEVTAQQDSIQHHALKAREDTILKCNYPKCYFMTISPDQLRIHGLKHKRSAIMKRCDFPWCDFCTTSQDDLTQHLLKHKQSRDGCCVYCWNDNFEFKTLKQHMQKNHLDKMLACPCQQCVYLAVNERDLAAHQAKEHLSSSLSNQPTTTTSMHLGIPKEIQQSFLTTSRISAEHPIPSTEPSNLPQTMRVETHARLTSGEPSRLVNTATATMDHLKPKQSETTRGSAKYSHGESTFSHRAQSPPAIYQNPHFSYDELPRDSLSASSDVPPLPGSDFRQRNRIPEDYYLNPNFSLADLGSASTALAEASADAAPFTRGDLRRRHRRQEEFPSNPNTSIADLGPTSPLLAAASKEVHSNTGKNPRKRPLSSRSRSPVPSTSNQGEMSNRPSRRRSSSSSSSSIQELVIKKEKQDSPPYQHKLMHHIDNDGPILRDPLDPSKSLMSRAELPIEQMRVRDYGINDLDPLTKMSIKEQVKEWLKTEGNHEKRFSDLLDLQYPVGDGPERGLSVYAKVDIPAFTVLGPYAGMLHESEDSSTYRKQVKKYGKRNIDNYNFGTNSQKRVLTAYGSGNILSYINTAQLPGMPALPGKEDNLYVMRVGKNLNFYVTLRLIKAGEELLVPYGETYGNESEQNKKIKEEKPE